MNCMVMDISVRELGRGDGRASVLKVNIREAKWFSGVLVVVIVLFHLWNAAVELGRYGGVSRGCNL